PESIAQRGMSFLRKLVHANGVAVDTEVVTVKSKSPGVNLTIWGDWESGLGGTQSSGARGLRIETVVQTGFEAFVRFYKSEATLDEYLADQIIVTAALAESPSSFKVSRLTSRLLTSIWVIKQFLPIHITVKGKEDQPGTVTIKR
ncbi:MAG: RNA 3'-terminal phosphate cyclase, partial [Fimbriimonadaceae bacterium]